MRNPAFDNYIENSAPFAQAILNHLRQLVHTACPDVEEQMKWSFPNFVYRGSILCHMASFKKHCSFGFWQGELLEDTHGKLNISETNAMGNLGKITSLADLPNDEILQTFIIQAMVLIESGVKKGKPKATPVVTEVPDCLVEALEKSQKAKATFDLFPPSKRKEYCIWINEAKSEATREKRLATTIEWLEEGKSRNWKYEKK
jgi:uncharacterized protein YdeI (YjbR/CyaY-like superfamily)